MMVIINLLVQVRVRWFESHKATGGKTPVLHSSWGTHEYSCLMVSCRMHFQTIKMLKYYLTVLTILSIACLHLKTKPTSVTQRLEFTLNVLSPRTNINILLSSNYSPCMSYGISWKNPFSYQDKHKA